MAAYNSALPLCEVQPLESALRDLNGHNLAKLLYLLRPCLELDWQCADTIRDQHSDQALELKILGDLMNDCLQICGIARLLGRSCRACIPFPACAS